LQCKDLVSARSGDDQRVDLAAADRDQSLFSLLRLGLYIARQIVGQRGGRIWAESAGEGSGTLVSIWLPNSADQAPGADRPSATREPLVPARSRILVVEDESAVRHTLRDALELEGYECRVAVDGRDAQSVLSGWSADIILWETL
jgi:two-component system CheB/CheR fusion protein